MAIIRETGWLIVSSLPHGSAAAWVDVSHHTSHAEGRGSTPHTHVSPLLWYLQVAAALGCTCSLRNRLFRQCGHCYVTTIICMAVNTILDTVE